MFQDFFRQVFDAFEPTLEEWLEENGLIACNHQLVIYESKTKHLSLDQSGEFNESTPESTQQTAVITHNMVTLEETIVDSMTQTFHINTRYSFMPIGENYFLVHNRKPPYKYTLYIRK